MYIGLKESVIKRCYKRIYYPVFDSLSTINHGNIFTGRPWSVMFVLRSRKKKRKKCYVSLSAPLWTWLCIRCNLCYISFFNDTNMSMVVRKMWFYGGKFLCLLKKQHCSQTELTGDLYLMSQDRFDFFVTWNVTHYNTGINICLLTRHELRDHY